MLNVAFIYSRKVYVRTEYAWYILDTPSENYDPFYSTFSTSQRIFHELIAVSIEDKHINRKEFLEHLESLDDADRDYTEADLQNVSTVSATASIPAVLC